MLRQIEWGVHGGPVTKNGVLPLTTVFFSRFCFSFRTSHKELIWCDNYVSIQFILFVSAGALLSEGDFPCEYPSVKNHYFDSYWGASSQTKHNVKDFVHESNNFL